MINKFFRIFVFLIGSMLLFSNARANSFNSCALVKKHHYNAAKNTITVVLDRELKTIEGKVTKFVDVLNTNQKLKVKIASTREGSQLCFFNLSYLTAKSFNKHLSKAAKNKVALYQNAFAEHIVLIQKQDQIAKYSL